METLPLFAIFTVAVQYPPMERVHSFHHRPNTFKTNEAATVNGVI